MPRNRLARRLAAVATAATACAVVVPPAEADSERVPRDAPVVAGPTASGGRLVAYDHGRELCLAFLGPRERRRGAFAECERPRLGLRDVDLSATVYPHRSWHYAVVRPEVAEAELVFRNARTARAPTSPGSGYTGRYAGRLRFLLIEAAQTRRFYTAEAYLRLFDAAGALIAIAREYVEPVRSRPARELRRGATSGVRWSLRAFHERALTPVPGNEERFVDKPCVEVWRRGPAHRGHALVKACRDADDSRERDSYSFQQRCGPLGLTAVGTVEPDIRAVVAVLGDGRVRRLRLSRLPASHGDGRAFALVLGRDAAVRRLVALKEGGGREVIDERRGPGSARCGDDSFTIFSEYYEPLAPTGPAAFTVYDEGALICATLGQPSNSPAECRHAPLITYESWILTRRAGDRRLVAGIVPSEVASVVVELARGRRIHVATSTDGGYAGQYAGRLRFFTLELPRRASIATIRLIDAAGQRLLALPSEDTYRPVGRPRLVVGGRPGLRLFAQRIGSGTVFGALCINIGVGRCGFVTAYNFGVRADCTPRRLVIWGLLNRGSSAVTIETDRGDVSARVERLPRALVPSGPGVPRYIRRFAPTSAFVAVVPARARPTKLTISGRGTSDRRLALPSASAQCGYADSLFLY